MIGFEVKITDKTGENVLYLNPGSHSGRVWIGDGTGESGEFDTDELFKVIQKFYKENL